MRDDHLLPVADPDDWHTNANCRGHDTDLWFKARPEPDVGREHRLPAVRGQGVRVAHGGAGPQRRGRRRVTLADAAATIAARNRALAALARIRGER